MMKILFGIICGIFIATYYPQITTTTTSWFVDSGVRDTIVETLNEVDK